LSAKLGLAPVYATGFQRDDSLYSQTAFSLESSHLMVATAGDPASVVVRITNNRSDPLSAKLKLSAPSGWAVTQGDADAELKPGASRDLTLTFKVAGQEAIGEQNVSVACLEGEKTTTTFPVRVLVQEPFLIAVSPIRGAAGDTTVQVTVTNQSAIPRQGRVALELPAGWRGSAPLDVADLKPGEKRALPFTLSWNADWKLQESARAVFTADNGSKTSTPVIPPELKIHAVRENLIGKGPENWPQALEMPSWLLGSTHGETKARLWLGWSQEGLYGAVEVHDAKGRFNDPTAFWGCDALEIFFTAQAASAKSGITNGNAQFWFVPLLDQNRVYAGRWKIKDEIPESIFDIPGVKSATHRTKDGYVMEFLLPASAIPGFPLTPGVSLRLNANLTVHGAVSDREVYWPQPKADGIGGDPSSWGVMNVVE
jgi:hypothetical protein